MKMFVFEEVLYDYTPGMAVIAAETLREAQELACKEFNYRDEPFDEWLAYSGFHTAEGTYDLPGQTAGIKHYVYGGG